MVAKRKAYHADDGLYMTVEQYFQLDQATDGKYEYLNGCAYLLRPPSSLYGQYADVLDLAGGSPAHAALAVNIAYLLKSALEDGPGMVYSSDAYVQLAEQSYVHSDVTVACTEQEEESQYITNPIVVIEVLSPSTEQKRDRGEKLDAYKRTPSLQEYLLVGSERKSIELYRRAGNFWQYYGFHEGDTIELASIGVRFAFERVYRGIRGIRG